MPIDPLEKMGANSFRSLRPFVGILMIDALFHSVNAASNVETVDSASLHLSEAFVEVCWFSVNFTFALNIKKSDPLIPP